MHDHSSLGRPLSLQMARLLQLAAQGLLKSPRRRARRDDVLATVERMRLLQIDTIHVVARSPYMVLHARLGAYPTEWLEDALERGDLAECWAHEACFVPAHDMELHRAWRSERHMHWAHRHALRIREQYPEQMDQLLARIRQSGPVRASDFARDDRGVSGWWQWKPEKRWLEAWFALGELMVTRRERFARVYDLAERVLSKRERSVAHADADLTPSYIRQRFILDSVRALGITSAHWIADYFRLKPRVTSTELAPLIDSGELIEVEVDGWDDVGYVHVAHRDVLEQARKGRLRATHTTVLSPFDPLVWDRARVRAMFNFDYTIECYVPAAKRRYGYYVLPILHRGALVGRLDAKAHRADGIFEIRALYLEPGVEPDSCLADDLAKAIAITARWHGTPKIRLGRCRPTALASALRARWKADQ